MEYLTAGEIMKKLNISRSTLYRWRKEGLPHDRIGHRTIRYDIDKVMKWLRERGKETESN